MSLPLEWALELVFSPLTSCHVTTINTIFIFIFIFIFFGAFLIRVLEYILKMPLYKFYDPVDFVLLDNKLFKGTDLGAII